MRNGCAMRRARGYAERQALAYVETMGGYERGLVKYAEIVETLDARLEGVGAVRFDSVGGTYQDKRPAILDALDETAEQLRDMVLAYQEQYRESVEIFAGNLSAQIVWLKWGRRMTWEKVAEEVNFSVSAAMRREKAGLLYIWKRMPAEYKQRRL